MRFVIDLWLDGYDSEEEMGEACKEFIEDQLNFSASGIKILDDEESFEAEWDAVIQWCRDTAQGIDNLDCNLDGGVGGMEIGKMHGFNIIADELEKRKKAREEKR